MHDRLGRRVAVCFLLLMFATAQMPLSMCLGSLAVSSYNPTHESNLASRAVILQSSCTNSTTTVTQSTTITQSTRLTQWTTTTYTQTVGIVTQFSYLYDTIMVPTTAYMTQTVSRTSTTILGTTLTKTSTAFLTTQTTSVTYYETQSTTQTETSYATASLTQYVYVESYVPGQVIEYANIPKILNGSEGTAHFGKSDKHKIETITIAVVDNATNIKISIATAPQQTSLGANTNEYSSFQIAATNLPDYSIRSVVIDFKVDRNWLSNNQIPKDRINLYRYENGEWTRLDTSLLRTDETYEYYEATSPGLSIFAIAGQSSPFFQIPGAGSIAYSYTVILSIIIVAILGAYGAIRIKRARSKKTKEEVSEPTPTDTSSEDQIEGKLLDYIMKHGGSISLSKAAEDLGVLPTTIKEVISQLKSEGKLAPV
jgi:PGF-pre-PGF domain-containing protein